MGMKFRGSKFDIRQKINFGGIVPSFIGILSQGSWNDNGFQNNEAQWVD